MDDTKSNLITLIRQYPVLWDPAHADHRDTKIKDVAAETIGKQFLLPKTKETVFKEWKSLKVYYQNRVNKKRSTRSGSAGGRANEWVHFAEIDAFLGAKIDQTSQSIGVHVQSASKQVHPEQASTSSAIDYNSLLSEDEDENESSSQYHLNLNTNHLREQYAYESKANRQAADESMNKQDARLDVLNRLPAYPSAKKRSALANSNENAKRSKIDQAASDFRDLLNSVKENLSGKSDQIARNQQQEDDLQLFLNSFKPQLRTLSPDRSWFEDVKFEIQTLLHENVKNFLVASGEAN